MYSKTRSTLAGLAVALGFVVVGAGLGDQPSAPASQAPGLVATQAGGELEPSASEPAQPTRRGSSLKRQLAMPYFSFAPLMPRQES